MIDRFTLKQKLKTFNDDLSSVKEVLEPDVLKGKIQDLEKASSDASFWNDPKKAKSQIDDLNDLKYKVKSYESLKGFIDELSLIMDLSGEDESMIQESEKIISSFEKLHEELETELLLSKKEDRLNAILEIHPGAGGTEALDWCNMLFRMYQMYATSHSYKLEILDYQEGEEVGIKSVTFKLSGRYAYGNLKGESGVHRMVRLSPFNSGHTRETTFASVLVTPELDDSIEIELKEEDLRIDIFHSSGAGGQGVNTSFSAVRVTHIPTGTVVTCQNERSQIQNKATALSVLKSRLYQMELDKRKEEMDRKLNKPVVAFGSQIRDYVFHPYTLCKDKRTQYETSQVDKVMNGELDPFIEAYLRSEARNE